MNNIMGATMIAVVVFGIGTASANDGVLFRNSTDPFLTTPAEFQELNRLYMQTLKRDTATPNGAAEARTGINPHSIHPKNSATELTTTK